MPASGFGITRLCEEAFAVRTGADSFGFRGLHEGSHLFYSVHSAIVGNFGVHLIDFISSLHRAGR